MIVPWDIYEAVFETDLSLAPNAVGQIVDDVATMVVDTLTIPLHLGEDFTIAACVQSKATVMDSLHFDKCERSSAGSARRQRSKSPRRTNGPACRPSTLPPMILGDPAGKDSAMRAFRPSVICRVMRHSSWETTRRHYAPGDVQKDADILNAVLGAA